MGRAGRVGRAAAAVHSSVHGARSAVRPFAAAQTGSGPTEREPVPPSQPASQPAGHGHQPRGEQLRPRPRAENGHRPAPMTGSVDRIPNTGNSPLPGTRSTYHVSQTATTELLVICL